MRGRRTTSAAAIAPIWIDEHRSRAGRGSRPSRRARRGCAGKGGCRASRPIESTTGSEASRPSAISAKPLAPDQRASRRRGVKLPATCRQQVAEERRRDGAGGDQPGEREQALAPRARDGRTCAQLTRPMRLPRAAARPGRAARRSAAQTRSTCAFAHRREERQRERARRDAARRPGTRRRGSRSARGRSGWRWMHGQVGLGLRCPRSRERGRSRRRGRRRSGSWTT